MHTNRSQHVRLVLFVLGVAVSALVMLGTASSAFAQENPYSTDSGGGGGSEAQGTEVLGSTTKNQAKVESQGGGAGLALTGAEIVTLTLVGGALVVGGGLFVVASKRKQVTAL